MPPLFSNSAPSFQYESETVFSPHPTFQFQLRSPPLSCDPPPQRPPADPEVLYYTLLSQALTLPLALRIQFLEDLRLSIQSGGGD